MASDSRSKINNVHFGGRGRGIVGELTQELHKPVVFRCVSESRTCRPLSNDSNVIANGCSELTPRGQREMKDGFRATKPKSFCICICLASLAWHAKTAVK